VFGVNLSGGSDNSVFPWDNAAGATSSSGRFGPPGGAADNVDLRLRDISPLSRRSSLGQRYSGGVRSSPGNVTVVGSPQVMGEDVYMFDGKR
jgi:hypothetical protein